MTMFLLVMTALITLLAVAMMLESAKMLHRGFRCGVRPLIISAMLVLTFGSLLIIAIVQEL